MHKLMIGATVALGLAGAALAVTPAAAATIVGVQVGPLGFSVGNGHYVNRSHRRVAYTYPSDWQTYHHPRSWYYSHRNWNTQGHRDWYRN